jgi:hypothetical protein
MSDATAGTQQDTTKGDAPKEGEVKDGQQAGGDPAASAKTKEKVVPEKYELQLPKDSPLDPGHLEKIAAYAKERGFSQEEAQAFMERDHEVLAAYVDQQNGKFNETRAGWIEAVKADKEIGGENMPKAVELARRALDRFGSKSLKDELNRTGLGDHPELVRLLSRVGKIMSNDSSILGGNSVDSKKSMAELLYGQTTSKEK